MVFLERLEIKIRIFVREYWVFEKDEKENRDFFFWLIDERDIEYVILYCIIYIYLCIVGYLLYKKKKIVFCLINVVFLYSFIL